MSDHERIWLEQAPGADEEYGRQWCQHNVWSEDATEYVLAETAATEISSLRSRVAELEGALKPFADEGDKWSTIFGDTLVPNLTPSVTEAHDRELAAFTVGDLRRARTALRDNGRAGE